MGIVEEDTCAYCERKIEEYEEAYVWYDELTCVDCYRSFVEDHKRGKTGKWRQ